MTKRRVTLQIPETGSHDQSWEAYTKLKKTHSRLVDFDIDQRSKYNTAKFRLYKNDNTRSKDTIKSTSAFRVEQKMASFFRRVESKLEPEKSEKDQLKQENQQLQEQNKELQEQNQEFHEEISELKSQINGMKEMIEQLTRIQKDKAEEDRSDTEERAEDLFEEAGVEEPEL